MTNLLTVTPLPHGLRLDEIAGLLPTAGISLAILDATYPIGESIQGLRIQQTRHFR
jgi:hypothetical protein